MKVGFRLKIDQQGKQFTGKGEKVSENGQTLPVENRTPIDMIGSIEGDKVLATFVECGKSRRTNGRFVRRLQNGADQLAGTFVTSAANSVVARR
jgi:exoribonuclease R